VRREQNRSAHGCHTRNARTKNLIVALLAALLAAHSAAAADKRLNNLVIEHVNLSVPRAPLLRRAANPVRTVTFDSPREGWLFLSLTARGPAVDVTLDSADRAAPVLSAEAGDRTTVEAMRYVDKGPHTVRVYMSRRSRLDRLVVRSIPEIIDFAVTFAATKELRPGQYGNRHDWDFFRKHMFRNSNVLVFERVEGFEPYIDEWLTHGKKALIKKNVPYYSSTADQIYEDWGAPLERHPMLSGLTIDEFGPSEQHQKLYSRWAAVLDRIGQKPKLRGKKAYTFWGSGSPKKEMRALVEAVLRNHFRWMHEGYYMHRKSTGDEAGQLKYIADWGSVRFEQMREMFPGLVENLLYTFGIANYHWTFDLAPELDFRVFLDLQFHHIVNEPAFKDMYGVCLYSLASSTEEICRYSSALVRHYCIEGRRDRFNTNPLELTHLKNPGFEEGLKHWSVKAAAPESVSVAGVETLPYKNTVTDRAAPHGKKVLATVRAKTAPNLVSQQISDLKPGALYSLRVLTADMTDTTTVKLSPLSINIRNVEMIPDESIDQAWLTRFTKQDGSGGLKAVWNFHFRVFRAGAGTARLTLSDWLTPDGPGGDLGHKLVWDFVQVQPFYPDEFTLGQAPAGGGIR